MADEFTLSTLIPHSLNEDFEVARSRRRKKKKYALMEALTEWINKDSPPTGKVSFPPGKQADQTTQNQVNSFPDIERYRDRLRMIAAQLVAISDEMPKSEPASNDLAAESDAALDGAESPASVPGTVQTIRAKPSKATRSRGKR